jgi:hypothetical protein
LKKFVLAFLVSFTMALSGWSQQPRAQPPVPIDLVNSETVNGVGAWHRVRRHTIFIDTCDANHDGEDEKVDDATSNTYGATLAGGGSDKVNVTCDGVHWIID